MFIKIQHKRTIFNTKFKKKNRHIILKKMPIILLSISQFFYLISFLLFDIDQMTRKNIPNYGILYENCWHKRV